MIRTALYKVGKNWVTGARDKSMLLAQEAQEALAKTAKQVTKPKMTFGTKSPATPPAISATEALGMQNRIFHANITQTSRPKPLSFGKVNPPSKDFICERVPYTHAGANITLTRRAGVESLEFSPEVVRNLPGYTDSSGNILPYLFLDYLEVASKGNGTGKVIMEDIIRLAKEKFGGRLLLIPSSARNPSPFYYKCGLRPTTEIGAKELNDYFAKGIPFKSGSSAPMYLPI